MKLNFTGEEPITIENLEAKIEDLKEKIEALEEVSCIIHAVDKAINQKFLTEYLEYLDKQVAKLDATLEERIINGKSNI